jgi:hypothetical protein
MVDFTTMAKTSRIHSNKPAVRRHFLAEWLEAKEITPMELLEGLNDPDRFSDLPAVDKSQIYRWIKGQMPNRSAQVRIAHALGFPDEPEKLMRDPAIDWIAKFFIDKTEKQKQSAISLLKLFFEEKILSQSSDPAVDDLLLNAQQVVSTPGGQEKLEKFAQALEKQRGKHRKIDTGNM